MTDPKNVQLSPIGSRPRFFQRRTHEASTFPLILPKRVAQKFHFAILRIEVTCASRSLSAIAEPTCFCYRNLRSSSDICLWCEWKRYTRPFCCRMQRVH